MLLITCTHRGIFGEETEFALGGEVHAVGFRLSIREGRMIDESVALASAH